MRKENIATRAAFFLRQARVDAGLDVDEVIAISTEFNSCEELESYENGSLPVPANKLFMLAQIYDPPVELIELLL